MDAIQSLLLQLNLGAALNQYLRQHRNVLQAIVSEALETFAMPLLLTPRRSSSCELTEWSIEAAKHDAFVAALAYLYLRQERNTLRVIADLDPVRRPRHGNVRDNVLGKLAGPDQVDLDEMRNGTGSAQKAAKDRVTNHIAQRDGLLFQHVSWIAARIALPNGHLNAPHVRKADKGFDGFIIEFDATKGKVERVILCEDKASEKPRKLIRESVWEEVRGIVCGERDDQILADLTTLLAGIEGLDRDGAEDAIDTIIWKEVRQFRVSVATGVNHRRKVGGYAHLLQGFEAVAPGDAVTRMGGVLAFDNVRDGLEALAQAVSDRVRLISDERSDV